MMMSSNVQVSFLLSAVLVLSGCKTWYRAGADGEDLARDQQRCEVQTGTSSGAQFLECMQGSGWNHMNRAAPGVAAESAPVGASVAGPDAAQPATRPDKAFPDTPTESGVSGREPGTTTGSPGGTGKPDPGRSPGLWIQRGAVAEPLEDALAHCGEAGAPEQTFYECMRAKGWGRLRLSVEAPGDLD